MDNTIQNFYQLNGVKGFKIVHLNIRSLPKKINQLKAILEGSTIDILTISESWLHDKIDTQLVQIQGYDIFRLDRKAQNSGGTKRGGGLVIYTKSSLDVYVQERDCSSTSDLDVQWIRVKRYMTKDIVLANIYRPPTGKVHKALKTLESSLGTLVKPIDEVLIMGDFNVNYKNQKSQDYKKTQVF